MKERNCYSLMRMGVSEKAVKVATSQPLVRDVSGGGVGGWGGNAGAPALRVDDLARAPRMALGLGANR